MEYKTPLPTFKFRQWYEKKITTIAQAESLIAKPYDARLYYRGMSKYEYICISTFFRFYCQHNMCDTYEYKLDRVRSIYLPKIDDNLYRDISFKILNRFRSSLNTLSGRDLELSQTSLMYLAQHYDLPTNLIDFSIDPKVALFFACCNDKDNDAVLYESNLKEIVDWYNGWAIHGSRVLMTEEEASKWAFDYATTITPDKNDIVTPIIQKSDIVYNARIKRQKGVFVYNGSPDPYDILMFNISEMTQHFGRTVHVISHELKPEILRILDKHHGINEAFLFPNNSIDINKHILEKAASDTWEYAKEIISQPDQTKVGL